MSRCAFFDLDGTLIDSVGGIANSVNMTRANYGFDPLPVEVISGFTGDGARKLLERSFADVSLPVTVDEAVSCMVDNYMANPLVSTGLYPGVHEGLRQLYLTGWNLAVVSNKPVAVGSKILAGLGIAEFLSANIGGGSGFPLKPSPDAFLYLAEKYRQAPSDCWILGDNHTDLESARRAGMKGVFAAYGFGQPKGCAFYSTVKSFAEFIRLIVP